VINTNVVGSRSQRDPSPFYGCGDTSQTELTRISFSMQDASVQVREDELIDKVVDEVVEKVVDELVEDAALLDRLRRCEALVRELRLQLDEKTAEMQNLQEELETLVEDLRLQLDEKTAQIQDLQEELEEQRYMLEEERMELEDDPAVLKKQVSPASCCTQRCPYSISQLSLRERFWTFRLSSR